MLRTLRKGAEALVGKPGTVVEVDDITTDGVRLQVNYGVRFDIGMTCQLHAGELIGVGNDDPRRKRFIAALGRLTNGSKLVGGQVTGPALTGTELLEMAGYISPGLQAIIDAPETAPAHVEVAASAAIFLALLLEIAHQS